MGFPFAVAEQILTGHDFHRFEPLFVKAALALFPCEAARFIVGGRESEADDPPAPRLDDKTRAGALLARRQGRPVADSGSGELFLPLAGPEGPLAVAVLTGGDPGLYDRPPEDWLLDRLRLLLRELETIKGWAQDPVSGALTVGHLRQELELLAPPGPEEGLCCLLLIETAGRAKDAGQALRQTARTAAYLDSLLGGSAPVHHLGAGLFALLWRGENLEQAQRLGYALLGRLKRQGLQRVQLGIKPLVPEELAAIPEGGRADGALDAAWEALAIARRRGVFALSIAPGHQPDPQSLAPPPPEALATLRRLWRDEPQFSIVFLQKDLKDQVDDFHIQIKELAAGGATLVPIDPHRALLYLPGADEQLAADWAGAFANQALGLGLGTFSLGIASHPCPGFRKADIPLNAKKALIHAQFFGAGGIASFSGVSLNIAGDIYYNQGDLLGAIREYRLGLNLNPENINLLNSLGVIYAQIDSHAQAIPLFERALAINPDDFMALFNLGFARLSQGDLDRALHYFERAERINDTYFDLELQLGQLYCQRGQYRRALKALLKAEEGARRQSLGDGEEPPWERCEPWPARRQTLGHGLVYRYLGEACQALGRPTEAMTYLQRAARYNSRDSEALSLLGELYAVQGQGLDIALAFCRQAVTIDSGKAGHWRRLALVLNRREEWEAALEAAERGLALAPKDLAALMLKATLHERLGQLPKARAAYEKVLKLNGTHAQAARALKRINQTTRRDR